MNQRIIIDYYIHVHVLVYQEHHGVEERASELSSMLEQQKIEAHHLQKLKQELEGEVEAYKLTVSTIDVTPIIFKLTHKKRQWKLN